MYSQQSGRNDLFQAADNIEPIIKLDLTKNTKYKDML
jgi:hypothetical protein